ncbi:MAG: roadblock/LC7 domain-containing protein [Candidatus Bathyarchaeota archaeon]|nr:MAG: roadblock/LC7 domain-containing protein [Candidatus Bathyarchaeota archaeon]
MTDETRSFALETTLNEVRNACPDVQAAFLLDKEANIIARDEETSEAAIEQMSELLNVMLEKAEAIGGLEELVIEGSKSNIHLSSIEDMYLTLVAPKKADIENLQTIPRVLIPTVIKVLDNLPTSPRRPLPKIPFTKPETVEIEEPDEAADEVDNDVFEDEVVDHENEAASSTQLIVESYSGLWVRGDTVQISRQVTEAWEDALQGQEVELVEVETFSGRSDRFKVKLLEDSKMEGRIIRIPEKGCQTLKVKKGELVRVKPVTE